MWRWCGFCLGWWLDVHQVLEDSSGTSCCAPCWPGWRWDSLSSWCFVVALRQEVSALEWTELMPSSSGCLITSRSNLVLVLCLNSDCQWEREQFVEPLGAAVCVPDLCTDCKPEPVLHIIFIWSAGEVTTRTGQWMERLLHRGNLQPALTSAC